jgi:hypothetical protein
MVIDFFLEGIFMDNSNQNLALDSKRKKYMEY